MKYMSVKEFRESGLLQEINRRFLHPMGLALAARASTDEEGNYLKLDETLGPIMDARDDPEGFKFSNDNPPEPDKTEKVDAMFEAKRAYREETLGYHVQPVPEIK